MLSGDSIVLKLPFDERAAGKYSGHASDSKLTVIFWLAVLGIDQDGEYARLLELPVKVENSLPWSDPSH